MNHLYKKTVAGVSVAVLVSVAFFGQVSAVVSVPVCVSGNLVANGDFELPVVTAPQGWDTAPSPVGGWTVEWMHLTGDTEQPAVAQLELHRNAYFIPASGLQFAELDSNWSNPTGTVNWLHPASVRLYQDIPTVPGASYSVQFSFSPRPTYGSHENRLDVRWDGASVATLVADGTSVLNTAWTNYTYVLSATGALTRLQFSDVGLSNSFGTFLDSVSVCPVVASPSPSPSVSPTPTPSSGGGSTSGYFAPTPTPGPGVGGGLPDPNEPKLSPSPQAGGNATGNGSIAVNGTPVPTSTPGESPSPDGGTSTEAAIGGVLGISLCTGASVWLWFAVLALLNAGAVYATVRAYRRMSVPAIVAVFASIFAVMALWALALCDFPYAWLAFFAACLGGAVSWFVGRDIQA